MFRLKGKIVKNNLKSARTFFGFINLPILQQQYKLGTQKCTLKSALKGFFHEVSIYLWFGLNVTPPVQYMNINVGTADRTSGQAELIAQYFFKNRPQVPTSCFMSLFCDSKLSLSQITTIFQLKIFHEVEYSVTDSVPDPEPDPPDPHVFGPP